ncbi:carbohydrate kinase family protein [Acidisarcina polymorpha]|uniref:carbohydrate kinase family protein n=1 Tax=Acidisarcina polymorpha TaxID=2211140 RepID=UPI001F28F8D4|nr:PfkB family carbohydrate kinase [Acidisarcina polymorpha]
MTVRDLDIDYLASARHFHLSSLFLLRDLQPGLPALFQKLKRRGLTSHDTNDDPEDQWNGVLQELLPYVDLLLPNGDEARRIARRDSLDEALDVRGEAVPVIAVKRGPEGSIVQQGKHRLDRIGRCDKRSWPGDDQLLYQYATDRPDSGPRLERRRIRIYPPDSGGRRRIISAQGRRTSLQAVAARLQQSMLRRFGRARWGRFGMLAEAA